MTLRAAAAIAFLFSAGCAELLTGGAPPVGVPEVKADDRWSYRSKNLLTDSPADPYEVRVTFAGKGVIQGVVTWPGDTADGDATWTAEWNSVASATDEMGVYDRVGAFDPHSGLFKFPLQAGASWESVYEQRMPRRADARYQHRRTVTVMGYEDVVVPAGRFRALKVVAEGSYRQVGTVGGESGTTRTVAWYAPAVKRWVKLTHDAIAGIQPRIRREDELESFKVQ